ncbi:LacI family DNA-binding transcriptional regulator [Paenibacillus sp. MMS20-IR301]|uniref:LacI family DNA-binding transcriptional regulator n=1 Tax=Paenibacillus sp. MMS20-IR301 TaxID=2895946 RepID=UPI0028EFC0B2|nr:LacI family DNA-binding transcriptional regulator [Paenibacillus sp. MMS20-IR301]WNS45618.1 LacI family DNA-binding transcriptional regulator [Paenibacillus sp. MMS20-IR301]
MEMKLEDIAARLGLSVSTVSRALNGSYGVHPKTIARVQETAAELGYVPNLGAKQLVTRKSNLVGVFMPEIEGESNREFEDIFAAFRKALRLYQKDILIFSVPFRDYEPGSLSNWIRMRNLQGCVFMPPFAEEHPVIKEVLRLQIPAVNMSSALGAHCSLVASDDLEGGRMAGAYLAEQGHRNIGYINGPEHLFICKERYRGFREAVLSGTGAEHGASFVEAGDFSGSSGAGAILTLLNREPGITAVCCANDLMAMGAIMELGRKGLTVPRDLSVIGYDGAFFTAYTNPPLTTIRHNYEAIGTRAAELLVEVMNGGPGRSLKLVPELVKGETVSRQNGSVPI